MKPPFDSPVGFLITNAPDNSTDTHTHTCTRTQAHHLHKSHKSPERLQACTGKSKNMFRLVSRNTQSRITEKKLTTKKTKKNTIKL